MARRGILLKIYSDNGTNLKAASKELTDVRKLDSDTIKNALASKGVEWVFNPPAAPHFGGSWERLIRSVKTTLQKISITRNPSDEVLRNLFAEVELTVNSRPLTYIPVEISKEAITPNHFLLGSSSGTKPGSASINDEAFALKNNWKTVQVYANYFWRRWVLEYLPTLTRRTKWFENVKTLDVGDIVIIID